MSRSRKTLIGLVALLLSTALIAWMTCHRRAEPQDLVITTGTEGGTYIKLGQLLAPILEESGETIGKVSSVLSNGSVQNIERLQYTGDNLCEPPREGKDPDTPAPECKAKRTMPLPTIGFAS